MKAPGSNLLGFDAPPKWTLGAICVAGSLLAHSLLAPFPKFSERTRPRVNAAESFAPSGLAEIPVGVVNDESKAAVAEDTTAPPEPEPEPGPASEPSLSASAAARPKQPARARKSASGDASGQAARPGLDVAARASSNSSYQVARALASDGSVSLLVDMASLRAHPRAQHLAKLIGEWQPFFDGEALDPLRDLERLLVIGPELRASGRGIALALHHLAAERVHAAIARAGAAVEHTEQGDRFYTQLSPELLLIAPERLSMRRTDVELPAPPSGSLGTIYIDDPHRALKDLPFEVPRTLHWVRGIIQNATADAIAVDIEAGDENAELAKRDAQTLTHDVIALKTKARAPWIDRARFEAIGSVIVGRLEVTPTQIDSLLDLLSELVRAAPEAPPPPEAKPGEPAAEADASDPAPPGNAAEPKLTSDAGNAAAPVADPSTQADAAAP